MKRLLILLFVFAELCANSQTKPSYFTPVATAYEWNWGRFKYGLRPPPDTLPTADSGSIAYKNGVWYGKNQYWSALGGYGGGSDSSLFATRYWAYNTFQPIGSYLTASDLTSYYTKTQINGFFSGVSSISGYNKSNWDAVHSAWAAVQALSPSGWATQSALVDSANQLRAAIGSGGGGSGDMTKAVYDANNNGIVDVLELSGVVIGNGTSSPTSITGTANQLLRRNAANTAYEFFTPSYLTSVDTPNISSFSVKVRSLFNGTSPIAYANGNISLDTSVGKWRSENYYNTKYQPIGSYVPSSRTITINGTTLDLSANRSWTISTSGGTWGSITGSVNSQTDLRDSLRARYVGMRQISDTSFALRKWNGTGFTEDTVVIQWADITTGPIQTTGKRSVYHIMASSILDSNLTSGINAAKIADGSVSNTEFQYISTVTSNVQTQLNNKLDSTKLSNDSLYDYHNGTRTFRGKASGTAGSVNDFRLLPFQIDSSLYAPASGASYFILPSSYSTKRIKFYREGEEQRDTTNGVKDYQYLRHNDTIFVFPNFYTRERCLIEAYPDSNWTVDNFPAPIGYDTDAQAYFDSIVVNGGTPLTTPQKDAINTFIVGEKADGVFPSYYDGMYITCLGSAASKLNLLNPANTDAAYRLTFNNGATFASTGVSSNGTNQTISSHFIPGLAAKMSLNDSHIAVYHRTSTGADNPVWGINQIGSQIYLFPKESGGSGAFAYTNKSGQSFTPASAKGFWIARKNVTNILLDKDNVNVTNNLDGGMGHTLSSSYDLVLNGWNNNGTPALSHAGEIGFISFGKYLDDTQATNHYNRVITLLTALGAN